MVPAHSHKVSRVSWYSGYCHAFFPFAYGAFTLYGRSFQDRSAGSKGSLMQSEPRSIFTPVWALSRSLAATYEIDVFFLFLRLLRCFSSPGSLRMTMDSSYGDGGFLRRVSPFRYPRVVGYLLLTAAFRSLSRLSSALSAKASTLRSYSLDLMSFDFRA